MMVRDKIKQNISWLENVIGENYGSRCQDFEKDCWCCKAWEFFDEVKYYCLPKCDWMGKCKNKAFREVYPKLSGTVKKSGWSHLCKKHFYEEQRRIKKLGKKLVWSGLGKIEPVRNYKLRKELGISNKTL